MPEAPKKKVIPKKKAKVSPSDDSKLEALSERLYARGTAQTKIKRTKLQRKTTEVPSDWDTATEKRDKARRIDAGSIKRPLQSMEPDYRPQQAAATPLPKEPEQPEQEVKDTVTINEDTMAKPKRARAYRSKLLIGGFVFFVCMLILSSLFFIFGNNTISGENITIAVKGDFAIGGGEEMPLQISIANENDVDIESATLIINYPAGTQKADSSGKELFIERFPLELLKSGEIRNIETSAVVFGEENAEKIISVSVEYRVSGSNATFYKEADPLRFKISSSPVVMLIDFFEKATSGQETEITLTIGSNAPTTLENVLIALDYPSGFEYVSADPSPVSGRNVWRIDELEQGETIDITIQGVINGGQGDTKVFEASAGIASERDRFVLASVYTTNTFEIDIESAFLRVDVSIDGSHDDEVILASGDNPSVYIEITNALNETLYDGTIKVVLGGNALGGISVTAAKGFYNSATHTITWDSADIDALKEMAPGEENRVSFSLNLNTGSLKTPEITLDVSAAGTRVTSRVPESLVGTESRTIRVSGTANIISEATFNDGLFANGGPIPPIAEETTTYTATFFVQNGGNDLVNATFTARLPQYVAWQNKVTSGDDVTFDNTSRMLTWDVGDIKANASATASIQVALTPSNSQVGKTPVLVEAQQFRGTDRFTGVITRATVSSLSTNLLELGGEAESGRVQSAQ